MTGLFDASAPRYAAGLNPRQREAVEHDAGPLIVLAGPGTGKTRVIVHRVARLLEVGAAGRTVEPESVLAVTFTVKAAAEMRSRLRELVGPALAQRAHVRTFHGFGRWLIRRFADVIGLRPAWRIMDSAERTRLMRAVIAQEHLLADPDAALGPEAFIADALEFVDECRQQGVTPAECSAEAQRRVRAAEAMPGPDGAAERARADRFARRARAYEVFAHRSLRDGALTFDDLIARATDLLADARVAPIVRADIRHVVVDEFQDVNPAQVRLLRLLAPPGVKGPGPGPDLCVVGDDDQAIYAFRGASERSFEHFSAVWGSVQRPVRTVALEENYRSDPAILRAAGIVITKASSRFAPDKALVAAREGAGPSQAPVEGVVLEGDDDAGAVIAALIDQARRSSPEPGDFAVIAHIHTHLARVATELEFLGVPFRAVDRSEAGADPGVLDLLAWIESLVDPTGVAPVQRLLARPPFSLSAQVISRVVARELAARSHARAFADPARPASANPRVDPLAWLEAAVADLGLDASTAAAITRFVALHRALTHASVTSPAHEVVRRIIGDAALAESDNLEGRDRARRVSALIAFLQFARSRADRLDQPGRLADLLAYYHDLSPLEQSSLCAGGRDAAIDADDPGAEDAADDPPPRSPGLEPVTLLTAHSAKGLEFGTVFVINVRPGGFPGRKTELDEPPLPQDWLDRLAAADGLTPLDRRLAAADEQRRLFYVACTRAKNRLVVLAKHKKTRTETTDYFIELEDAAATVPMRFRTGASVLSPAANAGADAVDPLARAVDAAQGSAGVRLGGRARERARRILADLVAELQSPLRAADADPHAVLQLADRVREQAMRLALAAGLAQDGNLPAWARDPALGEGVTRFAATLDERLRAGDDGAGPATSPLHAPLKLSFTSIDAYGRCPRCFYLDHRFGLREAPSANMSLGAAAHEALHHYYLEVRDADAEGRALPAVDRLVDLAQAALERAWPRSQPMPPDVWPQLRAQMRTLHARLHDPGAHTLHLEQFVRFPYEHRGTHEISAKLDRVDLAGPGRYRIIDYKTGAPTRKRLEPDRSDLQLGIYAMALRTLVGPDADLAGTAEYWILSSGEVGAIDLNAIKLDAVRRAINKAIDGMLDGKFQPDPSCTRGCADFALD
jgi:DNA helicase-2/ATP-dependent DNA helicase PcrA